MLQYIGARYVPGFKGAYDNTQAYEALDVVDNGSGTSYIAKIPVPAGTPLTNTTYWALYGSASGAIIHLQDEIDEINDALSNYDGVINVKAHGAVGDGVTDDSDAIQDAIDHGGMIFFPSGNYLVKKTIKITHPGTYLVGAGRLKSTIIRDQSNFDFDDTLLFNVNGRGVGMAHMSVRQKTNAMSTGAHIHITECTDGLFTDLWIDSGFDGITLDASARIDFISIWQSQAAVGSAGSYYNIKHNASGVITQTVVSCKFIQCDGLPLRSGVKKQVGFNIESADGLWFTDCHIQDTEYGLILKGNEKVTGVYFENCYFDESDRPVTITGTDANFGGIKFANCEFRSGTSTVAGSGSALKDITFIGCTFELSKGGSIVSGAWEDFVIEGCIFRRNGQTYTTGVAVIVLNSGAKYGMISGNVISDTVEYLIEMRSGSEDNVFTLNNCLGHATHNIADNGTDNVTTGNFTI